MDNLPAWAVTIAAVAIGLSSTLVALQLDRSLGDSIALWPWAKG